MREEGEGRDFNRVWVEHQGDGELSDFQLELVSLFFTKLKKSFIFKLQFFTHSPLSHSSVYLYFYFNSLYFCSLFFFLFFSFMNVFVIFPSLHPAVYTVPPLFSFSCSFLIATYTFSPFLCPPADLALIIYFFIQVCKFFLVTNVFFVVVVVCFFVFYSTDHRGNN